jgi:glyoxylase-like metal-dependent hydrolase (beta-lactamase superfamily II)
MADDIPFDRNFDAVPGKAERVAPKVRRVLANNPGPFTFKGTNTYIIGEGTVAILDPGPDDPAHVEAVLEAVRGETVEHILVSHTHRDHSPAARAVSAAPNKVLAEGPHRFARPLHGRPIEWRPVPISSSSQTSGSRMVRQSKAAAMRSKRSRRRAIRPTISPSR